MGINIAKHRPILESVMKKLLKQVPVIKNISNCANEHPMDEICYKNIFHKAIFFYYKSKKCSIPYYLLFLLSGAKQRDPIKLTKIFLTI